MRIFVNVARDNRIHGQAHESRVHRGNGEHSPHAQRSQQSPNPLPVGADDVFDGVQSGLSSLSENRSLVACRWPSAGRYRTTRARPLKFTNDHLFVCRLSLQQIERMRQQFDYGRERIHRPRRTARQIQDQTLPPSPADSST